MKKFLNIKMAEPVYRLKKATMILARSQLKLITILFIVMALFVIPATATDLQKSFVVGGDHAVWYNNYGGASWSGWQNLGGYAVSAPTGEVLGSKTYVFVRGGDNAVWYRSYDSTTWSNWQSIGGNTASDPKAISYGSKLYVFVRGGDNAVWYRLYDGTSWGGWKSLGGYITLNPDVSIYGTLLTVFARGGDNAVWLISYNGATWSPWNSLGGDITSSPVSPSLSVGDITSSSVTNLFVFARGRDNAIWAKFFSGSSWSNWQSLGGYATTDPKVNFYGSLYVFVRGGDNAVWYRFYDGASWSSWQSLGGYIVYDLEIKYLSVPEMSYQSNLYIYAIGGDNAEWYRFYDGTSWSSWQSLGGSSIRQPETILFAQNHNTKM